MTNLLNCAVLSSVLAIGCAGSEAADRPYAVSFEAKTDEGKPLEGVGFSTGKKVFGASPALGSFSVRVHGPEGTALPVAVVCPLGYLSPGAGSLRLTRVESLGGQGENPLSFAAVCTRQTRDVVVVVHAENGGDLPVAIDGEVKGRTDQNGNAHVLVAVDRAVTSVAVSLDTAQRSTLRPQDPRRVFELKGNDAALLLEQPFTEAKRKRSVRSTPSRPSSRPVPYRLK